MLENKPRILSTAVLEDSVIREAIKNKISLDVISFIKIQLSATEIFKQQILQLTKEFYYVIITSSNAVEAVIKVLGGYKPDWKFFCIGYKTSQLIENYFGPGCISGRADNAAELAHIISGQRINHAIFFSGDQRREELPEKLLQKNIDLKEIIVYKTLLIPNKVEKLYDGILFFSPSAVQSFFSLNNPDVNTIFFAIGKTTAEAIKTYSNNRIIISDIPGKERLIQIMIQYFQVNPIHIIPNT